MDDDLTKPLYARSLPLLKEEGLQKIRHSKVAIFGLGGVGSYAAEALARSGIGHLELIDKEQVDPTNLNRQLCALESTIGQAKVDVVAARIKDINPEAIVIKHHLLYKPDMTLSFLTKTPGFIVDAIDDVPAKLCLILQAHKEYIPIISALGAGNKYDPTKLEITDIYKTYNDRLAKALRAPLRKAGIKKHTVVFSPEIPAFKDPNFIASLAFVPSVSGLLCASHVVRSIIGNT